MLIYKKHVIDFMYGYVSVRGYDKMFTSIEDAKKFVDKLICDADRPYYDALEELFAYKYDCEPDWTDESRIVLESEYLEDYDINIEVYFDMYSKMVYKEINSAIDDEWEADAEDIRMLKDRSLIKMR